MAEVGSGAEQGRKGRGGRGEEDKMWGRLVREDEMVLRQGSSEFGASEGAATERCARYWQFDRRSQSWRIERSRDVRNSMAHGLL
eukprot:758963-Hanusia_phi.AAC.2